MLGKARIRSRWEAHVSTKAIIEGFNAGEELVWVQPKMVKGLEKRLELSWANVRGGWRTRP